MELSRTVGWGNQGDSVKRYKFGTSKHIINGDQYKA